LDEFPQTRMKTMVVVGARPNFMKAAPIIDRMRRYNDFLVPILVHTGQHYDQKLSQLFFDDLKLPKPDLFLGVGSGSHAVQTAKIMVEFEKIVIENRPDIVVVMGDVNSTIACAIVAAKCHIPIAHVEAGLRSFDMGMPEEINRVLTDRISDYLFVTETSGYQNLIKEGADQDRIFLVGNVMIDSLLAHLKIAQESPILAELGLEPQKFALLTLHRPDNVDDRQTITHIIEALAIISQKIPIIFPCHPRTRLNIDKFNLGSYFDEVRLRLVEPAGYLDFLKLQSAATMVLTDSGGVQEETTILNIPCLTLRKNTERPVTITEGTNILVGPFPEKIVAAAENVLNGNVKSGSIPKYWDGRAAERIVEIFLKIHENLSVSHQTKRDTDNLRAANIGMSEATISREG
jgi:UDP-N-acetylglucosamine 2-epimerase (non-hydrolysing)